MLRVSSTRPIQRCRVLLLWAVMIASITTHGQAQDRLVLRDTQLISGKVESLSVDGVSIRTGDRLKVLSWDQIDQGKVDAAISVRFNNMLKTLGEPLFRIRRRIKNGDFEGCLEHSEKIYPHFSKRRSTTAYMVCQSLMWARIASGKREAALEPYMRCYDLQRRASGKLSVPDSTRRLLYDPKTAMSDELPSIWFDQAAAKAALPGVGRAISDIRGDGSKPLPDGFMIYYATLSLAAGKSASPAMRQVKATSPRIAQLRDIVSAQVEVMSKKPGTATKQLIERHNDYLPANRALAIYWIGRSRILASDSELQKQGLVDLLHLPALFENESPELAAAAVYAAAEAMGSLGDKRSRSVLRNELGFKFGQTYHGRKLRSETNIKSDTNEKTP